MAIVNLLQAAWPPRGEIVSEEMNIPWLDEGEDVRYLGPDPEMRKKQGRVTSLQSADPAGVEVDFGDGPKSVAPWHVVRRSERAGHRHEKLAEGLHFFEWRGYENNCNAVVIEAERNIIVDPGHGHLLGSLFATMVSAKLDPGDFGTVLITHGHPDHIEGAEVFAATGATVGMSSREWEYLSGEGGMLFRFFGADLPDLERGLDLSPPSTTVEGVQFDVMHTPGHSPGSVCLFDKRTRALIVGDVVFPGGAFGRCDFPGGSYKTLLESFGEFDGLSPEFLLSGHGPPIVGRADVSDSIESSRKNLRAAVFNPW